MRLEKGLLGAVLLLVLEQASARSVSMVELTRAWRTRRHFAFCEKYQFILCSADETISDDMLRWTSRVCDDPDPPIEDFGRDKRSPDLKTTGPNKETVIDWFNEGDWVVIEVGRDPWQRAIASFYQDLHDQNLSESRLACEVAKHNRGDIACDETDDTVSFTEFANFVSVFKDSGRTNAQAFESQTFSCPTWLDADYSLRYENLEEGLKALSDDFGFDPDIVDETVHAPTEEEGTQMTKRMEDHYYDNCDDLEKITNRYKEDAMYFGYAQPFCISAKRNVTFAEVKKNRLYQRHVGYCRKHHFLICSAALAASKEMLQWTSRVCDNPDPPIDDPYVDPRAPTLKNAKKQHDIDEIEGWFQSWTIVEAGRNPWSRAIAVYYEDFFDTELIQGKYACAVAKTVRPGTLCTPEEKSLTFEEFLDYITRQPNKDRGADEHFASQLSVCPAWLQPDYSVRFEKLDEGLSVVSEKLGLDFSLLPPASSLDALQIEDDRMELHYGSNCTNVERVRERYLADIEYFGYEAPECEDIEG